MSETRRKGSVPSGPTDFVGGSAPPRDAKDASMLLEIVRREAYLVVASGPRREAEFTLCSPIVSIGRDETADFPIHDTSASRRHATVEKADDGYYLCDLGSTNGTYFDGLLHGKRARLQEGDRFRIGQTELVFHDETTEPLRNG